ncbi:hypothetical protein [Saccharopolyspora sp. CA-218241]|uniref:hypothetical protein n=1 Tax=Saccharopolyspora sp. CA-218241 TaxID=3240027 RepID=UPI003D95D62A
MTHPYGQPPGNHPPQQGQPMPPPGGYAPPSGGFPSAPQGTPQPGMPPQPGMQPPGMQPQPGMQPPGMPPQPMPAGPQLPPPPPGMGRVVLDCSYFPLAFILALFKPTITINGQPGPPGVWGKLPIDLPPGQHHIQVHTPYLWAFGHAVAVVPVAAGQQVDVYYKPPAIAFGAGAIGPVPQETPQLGLTLGIMGGIFVLCLLLGLLPMLML